MNNQKRHATRLHFYGIALVIYTTVLGATLPAIAAPSTPYIAATGGVWDPQGIPIIPEVLQAGTTAPVLVVTGSLPLAYGAFASAYGSNGFDIQVSGGKNQEVDGGSVWSDGFSVTGGTGSGILTVSSSITGSVAGLSEMDYALFVSSQPYDLATVISTISANHSGFWALNFPNASRLMFSGVSNGCGAINWSRECGQVPFENFQGQFNQVLSASVPFIAGQNIYVLSLFAGGVGSAGGIDSFLNSAVFGISAPADTTLQSLSNTAYAAAVPEPSMAFLSVIGLGTVALFRRSWRTSLPEKDRRVFTS